MKKILSGLLVTLVLMSCLPIMASAESEPIELNWFSLNGAGGSLNYEAGMEAIEAEILKDTGINCKINMISSDSFDTSMLAMKVASGELDLISSNMPWNDWQGYIQKGILLDIGQLLDKHGANIYAQIDPKLWDPYKVKGATYVIPVQAPVPFYCSTWVRMDLLEKYGFGVPNTTGELMDAVATVVANEPDMVGFTSGHISWFFNSGALQYHPVDAEGNMTRTNEEGTAMAHHFETSTGQTLWFDDPNMAAHLDKVAGWYANGAIDPELFTTTFDHADSLLKAGRVVVTGNSAAARQNDYPEEKWVNLTHLVNDFNGGATTWAYSYEVGMHIGIISTTKYAEEIIRIIDWLCASEENYLLSNYGVEGVDYNWVEREDGTTYIERNKTEDNNLTFTGGPGGIIQNIRADFQNSIKKGYEDKQAAYEDSKCFMDEPTTKVWYANDAWVAYDAFDSTMVADMTTIADEMFTKIVCGEIGAEEGLTQCFEMLKSAGYEEWYEHKNAQYCEAFGLSGN
jgi:ABC-type glycerol-3-phosphate transport system substrate-binding protein